MPVPYMGEGDSANATNDTTSKPKPPKNTEGKGKRTRVTGQPLKNAGDQSKSHEPEVRLDFEYTRRLRFAIEKVESQWLRCSQALGPLRAC